MKKQIIKVLSIPGKDFRVVIYRTEHQSFSYAIQWWDEKIEDYGQLGPACGLYDSVPTAENEARLRIDGLDPLEDHMSVH